MTQTPAPPPGLIASPGAVEPGPAASSADAELPAPSPGGSGGAVPSMPGLTSSLLGKSPGEGVTESRDFPYQRWHPQPNIPDCGACSNCFGGLAATTEAQRGQPIKFSPGRLHLYRGSPRRPHSVPSLVAPRFWCPRCGEPLWVSCPLTPHSPSSPLVSNRRSSLQPSLLEEGSQGRHL